jgi:hypothetical protein
MHLLDGPHVNIMQNLSISSLKQLFNTIQGTNSNNYIGHVLFPISTPRNKTIMQTQVIFGPIIFTQLFEFLSIY